MIEIHDLSPEMQSSNYTNILSGRGLFQDSDFLNGGTDSTRTWEEN
jgi:hypothetical protein